MASDSGAQTSGGGVYVTPSSTVVSPPSSTPPSVSTPATVLGTSTEQAGSGQAGAVATDVATTADSATAAQTSVLGSTLARTGQNAPAVLGIGLAAIVAGGFLLVLRRRGLASD